MKLLPVKQQLELEDEDDDGTEKELILFRVDGTIILKVQWLFVGTERNGHSYTLKPPCQNQCCLSTILDVQYSFASFCRDLTHPHPRESLSREEVMKVLYC